MDKHYFGKLDSDVHKSDKLDLDPHQSSQNSGEEAHIGGVEAQKGALEGL